MDWLQHERRKRAQPSPAYQGEDRRKQYSHAELPPHPTAGAPGVEARNQQWLEREREAERERSESPDNKPGPWGT